MIHVPGYGPSTAKLALVGEAPGSEEERQGIPFVGPTGKLVEECLASAGLSINDVYRTNVVKVKPPDNDLKRLHQIGYNIGDFIPQLREEMERLNPNCILAIGGVALQALTGFNGIKNYRGSILKSLYGHKTVGTIHPASLLKGESESMLSWKDLTYIKWDFQRAAEESKISDLDLPRRNLFACKSYMDLYRFLKRNSDCETVSVDIETFRTIPICIGLAFSPWEAISVPLFNQLSFQNQQGGMTRTDLLHCWKEIAELLANPKIKKIGQNFKFDEKQCDTCVDGKLFYGLKINGFFFDTLLAFRTLYPELPGRLEFIASVLTREPYWKEEGKGFNPKKDKFDRLLLYNAKDAAVTYEVYERELQELRERNQEHFFFTRVMPLHPFYSRLESRGILRDEFQRRFLLEKYKDQLKDLQTELDSLCEPYTGPDRRINANSNGAKGDVPWLVFVALKLPARESTDEKSLDALMRNHCQKFPEKRRILELILLIRKVRKTIGTYIEAEADHRGRICTSVRIALETGRTSTGILKSPVTTEPMGMALQTVTKHGEVGTDIRSQFIPDPGYVFLEPDQSGAEARVVAILAKDEKLLKIFEYNLDLHRITLAWVKGLAPDGLLSQFFQESDRVVCRDLADRINKYLKDLINQEERQLGKKGRHAANYDMGKRVASVLFQCSEWRAGQILDKIHSTNENIRGVFHKEVQDALAVDRRLINPFNRDRVFLDRWGDELFKEAYAQIPQSTVSDQTKFAAIRIERRLPYVQILAESHDAFLSQVPISKVDEAIRVFKEEMEQPIDFSGCSLKRGTLIIPCEIVMGDKNWEVMKKVA